MIVFSLTVLISYLVLIGSFCVGFEKLPKPKSNTAINQPTTTFSIVIPFRNEAKHLPQLLQTLALLQYPKGAFEILLVNDASTDNSEALITNFSTANPQLHIRLLINQRHSKSPKKDAIQTAIQTAKHQWIITTDADCLIPELWLDTFNNYIQSYKPVMLVAPVTYIVQSSFLNQFQWFDMMSLQGATIGGFGIGKPFLCNGANLAYKKSVFINSNGFNNNNTIASGDDIFMLENMVSRHPKRVHYVKDVAAIVYTHAQPNIPDLIQQRKRWASKTKAYRYPFSKLTGVLVFLMNALVITLGLWSCFGDINVIYILCLFIAKCSIDFILIFKSASFFRQTNTLKWYVFSAVLYPFFCTFIVGASIFSSYKWKGREFAK